MRVSIERPWPTCGMTSALWLEKPVREFSMQELVVTQPGVYFAALFGDPPTPVGGDPLPHVVIYQGTCYLEDGHHRLVRALISGRKTLEARYLEIDSHLP